MLKIHEKLSKGINTNALPWKKMEENLSEVCLISCFSARKGKLWFHLYDPRVP